MTNSWSDGIKASKDEQQETQEVHELLLSRRSERPRATHVMFESHTVTNFKGCFVTERWGWASLWLQQVYVSKCGCHGYRSVGVVEVVEGAEAAAVGEKLFESE